ncbi:MAG: hypothetical protein PWQ84_1326 [Thermotogaceae bacterium]|jgi:uncharacterized membrane protein|nr:hypothetical protein [Thermotogaceae bacterium]
MKNVGRVIIACAVAFVLFLVVQFVTGYYGEWFTSSKYSIESARIEQTVKETGEVEVHEVIKYDMRKPFKGLYRYVPPARYVKISNVRIWVEEDKDAYVQYLKNNENEFEARVWIVPYGSTQDMEPDGKEYTLHVSYVAKYVVENGKDCTQIFRQFWGSDWDAPVNNLTAVFNLPSSMIPTDIYTHPKAKVTQNDNIIEMSLRHLPPYAFAETRMVFKPQADMQFSVANNSLDLEGITKEENKYNQQRMLRIVIPIVVYVVILALLILVFRIFGKEPEIQYQGIYERELPTKDSPDFVNAAVVNLIGNVDNNGISAVMLDLYRKDYISFGDNQVDKKKLSDVIRFKKETTGTDLSESEAYFFNFLKGYSVDNQLDFSDLKKSLKKSESKAKAFNSKYNAYQSIVKDNVKARGYFKTTGYIFALLLGILLGIGGIVLTPIMIAHPTADLQMLAAVLSGIYLLTAAVILFLPKDVFGKWTKEGLTYYRKWINLKKFLEEFSLMSEYPPDSVIVWEEFLVYATAFGIADKVEKALKKLVPKEQWERQSNHSLMYGAYGYGLGYNIGSVRNVALQTVSKSSSGSGGGFSGGAGGAGGGSGGGGGGAF